MHSRTSMGPLCTSNLPSQAGAMQPARLEFVQLKDKQNITQAWQGQDWECYNTPSPLRLHIRQNRQQARAAGTKASHAGSLRNHKKAKLWKPLEKPHRLDLIIEGTGLKECRGVSCLCSWAAACFWQLCKNLEHHIHHSSQSWPVK